MAELILQIAFKQSKGWNLIQVPAFFFDCFAISAPG